MVTNESDAQIIARIAREAREVAARVPFDERADLLRGLTNAVRNAVKFDATFGGAPQGREWEMDRLDVIIGAAEDYYDETLKEKRTNPAN